jgi:endonuclease/exonuclease/phosphatase (EEP) superfamily protein YafD
MTPFLLLLLHLLVTFLAIATLLAILFPRRPLLGVSQHWGLQLWQLGLIAAVGALVLIAWWALVLAVAVAGYWSWRLWPRRTAPDTTGTTSLFRIASANLLYENVDFERILERMSTLDSDILVVCEATAEARQHLRRLEMEYPHAVDTCGPDNVYGIVILSRFPITLRSSGIGEDPMPRHLGADLAVGSRTIALLAIHPSNPIRFDRANRIPGEFDAVAGLCRAAAEDLILIGDCNAAGWSTFLRDLEKATGVVNDGVMRPSWPTWLPPLVRLPLDHVWVRGRVALLQADLGPKFGSDHLPLIAEIGWRDK